MFFGIFIAAHFSACDWAKRWDDSFVLGVFEEIIQAFSDTEMKRRQCVCLLSVFLILILVSRTKLIQN